MDSAGEDPGQPLDHDVPTSRAKLREFDHTEGSRVQCCAAAAAYLCKRHSAAVALSVWIGAIKSTSGSFFLGEARAIIQSTSCPVPLLFRVKRDMHVQAPRISSLVLVCFSAFLRLTQAALDCCVETVLLAVIDVEVRQQGSDKRTSWVQVQSRALPYLSMLRRRLWAMRTQMCAKL
ncbi:unnamed protein product [Symbiodinium natans]|uniref:Uncharacterized protein n=1 Tax=Symbiodinium natans TaxID=878477 RepID=A0A812HY81_9DINO|nr:unnamed protein product [Symbiodinium natans]